MTIDTNFETVTRVTPRESHDGSPPNRFDVTIADGWQQGRGAFGGYVIAALVRASEAALATPNRPLRSLTATLPGATPVGPADITTETLRVGSNVSTIDARLSVGGQIFATSTSVWARVRATSEPDRDACRMLAPPTLRPWHELPALPVGPPSPVFTQHLELRADGALPFTGDTPLTQGWVRWRTPIALEANLSSGAFLAGIIDAWWPAHLVPARAFRPMATVGFTLQIIDELAPDDRDAPLAYRGYGLVMHAGWAIEQRELWHRDGRLLALNQQSFAIIR